MKVVIVGVGNILFKDEGIGIYASKYLQENFEYDDHLEVIDGGTLGFKLMTYYQDYDKVIILDTVSIKDESGSIYNIPSDELLGLGSYRQTAHEVEVVEMLEICSLLEKMAEVRLIGIVPEDIESVDIDLTDKIKGQFDNFINVCVKELEDSGCPMTPKARTLSCEQIIDAYANPTMERE